MSGPTCVAALIHSNINYCDRQLVHFLKYIVSKGSGRATKHTMSIYDDIGAPPDLTQLHFKLALVECIDALVLQNDDRSDSNTLEANKTIYEIIKIVVEHKVEVEQIDKNCEEMEQKCEKKT